MVREAFGEDRDGLAGASGMGWARCALAATAGALPEVVIYSWAGQFTNITLDLYK